jgi:4-amino-4-deoxy-L-arabinose transferase-like glycosyltransferase
VLLVGIVATSLGLRMWGSSFGLPEYTRYHPDEHALVERAAQILWTGDWNLGRFNYPPVYAYLNTGAYALYFLYGVTQELWRHVPTFAVPQYYHVGRLLTAFVGTSTVVVVFLIGRQLRSRRMGLLAAVLLAGNYLHVIHSHYATFDVMVGFLVTLTLLFSQLIQTRGQARWYLLAGLCAGLAGATKYNGAIAVILPLLAHVLASPWSEWGWLDGRVLLAVGGFVLGFFGGNPFALGNLPEFLNDLATVLHHYGTEQPGFEGRGNWRWYARALFTSADVLWVAAGILGLSGMTVRNWKEGLLIISFPAIYFLMIARFVVRFERNLVPIIPFLALGGAWVLDVLANWLERRLKRGDLLSHGLAAVGAILLLALPLLASVSFDRTISQVDHREMAGRWVEENVEPESQIAIEHYAIPFDYDQYHVEDVLRITNYDMDWYKEQGYNVLIVSDGVWEILRARPEHYADMVEAYEQLTSDSELLAEFVPQPPGLVVAGYPTVAVYHFAPVRIYRVLE